MPLTDGIIMAAAKEEEGAAAAAAPSGAAKAHTPAAAAKGSYTAEDASSELAELTASGRDVPALRSILKEHPGLKEKIDKLKSLLGRSAKAQREAKVDLEGTQKRLAQAVRENERLNQKLDKLQSRPTHRECITLCRQSFDTISSEASQISNLTPLRRSRTNSSRSSDGF